MPFDWNVDAVLRVGLTFQAVPYYGGLFTASGGMSFTVESADLLSYRYCSLGSMLFVIFTVVQASVSGGGNSLFVRLPENCLARVETHAMVHQDIGGFETGHVDVSAGSPLITIQRIPLNNYPPMANTLHIGLQMFLEVS